MSRFFWFANVLFRLSCNSPRAPTVPAKSQPPFIHPSNCNQSTRNARCDSFGGGRRLLLGEPSANTPYPLARTFAPPPHCRRSTQESRLHQTTIPPTISSPIQQPRPNNPSCRIQERFRHNHPSFVILQLRQLFSQSLTISAMKTRSLSPVFTRPCEEPLGVQVESPARTARLAPLSSYSPSPARKK